MKFELRNVKNGCALKVWIGPDESGEAEELVYQESFDEDQEIDRFAEFLQTINEHYGPSTSRYSPKRIYIRVEPGDKYEGQSE